MTLELHEHEAILNDLRDAETTEEILTVIDQYVGKEKSVQSMAVIVAAGNMLEKRVDE